MLLFVISCILFFLPLYFLRLPIVAGSFAFSVSFVEVGVYIAFFIFLALQRAYTRKAALRVYASVKEVFWHGNNRWLGFGILFLFLGLFLATTKSADPMTSAGIIRGWFFAPIILFFLINQTVNKNYDRVFCLQFLALSGVWLAAVSLGMGALGYGFDHNGRLQGFFESPNYLAMYAAPLVPLFAYFAITNRARFYWFAFWLFALLAALGAVFVAFSQGAWLGILGSVLVAVFLLRKELLRRFDLNTVVKAAAVAVFLAVLAFALLGGTQFVDEALKSRLGIWETSLRVGAKYPILGIGPGMFEEVYQYYWHVVRYPVAPETAVHPHNIFLTFWLYSGLLGLAGFLLILAWAFRAIYKVIQREKQARRSFSEGGLFGAVLLTALLIILLHGLFDTTYWKNDLAFMFWAILATLGPRDLES